MTSPGEATRPGNLIVADQKLNLPVAAVESLAAELEAIARSHSSFRVNAGRGEQRLAVTYQVCGRDTDALPDRHVELESLRLLALSQRCVDRNGAVARKSILGIYKFEADMATGRLRLACVWAMALGAARGGRVTPDPRTNPTAARAAVLMSQEIEDADSSGFLPGLALPRFYYAFERGRPPRPERSVSAGDWAADEVPIGNLRAWPAEYFARAVEQRGDIHPLGGPPAPAVEMGPDHAGMAQRPSAIFAGLSHLAARSVRNPAYRVLQDHEVIPRRMRFRAFLESVSPHTGSGRVAPDPGHSTRGAGQFRSALAAYIDGVEGGVEMLMDDLRAACTAAGVAVPEGDDEAYERLAGMLENPWQRAEVPDAAGIQKIILSGPPAPSTMVFSTGTVEADLYDLGEYSNRYVQVADRRVVEAFRQKYGRRRDSSGDSARR